jgi:hypothetical protein
MGILKNLAVGAPLNTRAFLITAFVLGSLN